MKPFFQTKLGKLYKGNCLDIMPKLKPVNLTLTSPPYNMRLRIRNGEYTKRGTGGFSVKYKHFHDAYSQPEYYKIHRLAIKRMLAISPVVFWNIQIVTGSKQSIFRLIGKFHQNIKDIFIWDKGISEPSMQENVANRGYELIVILERNGIGRQFSTSNFKRGTMKDIWRFKQRNKNISQIKATFPLELATKVIQNWTIDGDIVLDPFAGSGTTAIACERLNRKWISIELTEGNCKIAARRIQHESKRLQLFSQRQIKRRCKISRPIKLF